MRDMKEAEGLTYAEISAKTNPTIPARTIERKLSPGGDGQDIMRETARAIEEAILGLTPHPCYLSFLAEASGAVEAKNSLEEEIVRLQAELIAVKEEAQKKIDYLLADNKKKDTIIEKLLDRQEQLFDLIK